MKVLLDTSFLYSALFHPSPRFDAVMDYVFRHTELLIQAYVADELIRKALEKRPDALGAVLAFLEYVDAVEVSDDSADDHSIRMRDPNDQLIMDAAIAHGVDIIISSDKDFTSLNLDHPRIMTPAQFIAEFL